MKKHLTNAEIEAITDRAHELANDMRDAARFVEADKIERIDNVWSKVAALQNIITACSELAGKLVIRDRVQLQQADLARLKDEQK
jgi:hypothetical protein